jgi:hypothetical protein
MMAALMMAAVTAKGTDAQGKPVSGVSVWEKQ